MLSDFNHSAQFGNQSSNKEIVLNEHEKSVFLTLAQESLLLSLYDGKNVTKESFESNEESRRLLSNLIEEAELTPLTNTSGNFIGMGTNSYYFTLPDGSGTKPAVWFLTYESVTVSYEDGGTCGDTGVLEVIPVKQDEYHKLKKNPFRGANDRRALRLDLADNNVEVVSNYTVTKYYIRYLKRPTPIVLANLYDGVTIDGVSTPTECVLHESLHHKILEIAVKMVIQSKGYQLNQNN